MRAHVSSSHRLLDNFELLGPTSSPLQRACLCIHSLLGLTQKLLPREQCQPWHRLVCVAGVYFSLGFWVVAVVLGFCRRGDYHLFI